ncbi:MAG: hypothetical protein ACK4LQ_00750 [Pararhodobacter sp.]
MTTKNEMAEQAAEMIGAMLLRLHSETGLPLDCILAGAHAQVITMMTTTLGGPMTAHCCEQAAERVRTLPSLDAVSLAFSEPFGRA